MKISRGALAVAGTALVLVAGLGGAYWALFERAPATVERPTPPKPAAPETLTVAAATGTLEVAGPDGVWHPAAPGVQLGARDRVRTSDDGEATLRTPDGSEVRLRGATTVRVEGLRRELRRLVLGEGMVEADVRDDPSRVFELALSDDAKDDATARTRGGTFTASSNGKGTAAVAVRRGEVVLAARGREVVIRAGEQSRVLPGQAPEAPTPIPSSLFLKLAWPRPVSTSNKLAVTGTTAPGARVRVAGRYLPVDEHGSFRTELTLPDGPHQLDARAVDVAGHDVKDLSPRIVVDTQAHLKVQAPSWK